MTLLRKKNLNCNAWNIAVKRNRGPMKSNAEIIRIEDIKKRSRHIFEASDFVEEAYLFGSYARGEATPESDIDFMIVLSRSVGLDFFGLYHFLSEEFDKNVDVITEREALEIMPESIERDKIKIYERKN